MLRSSVAFAVAALAQRPLAALGFPAEGGEPIPFVDVQGAGRGLQWKDLQSWLTPSKDLFAVSHYGMPEVNATTWRLELAGLVGNPMSLSLEELKAMPSRKVIATLECSGNSSNPGFMGAVGNLEWTGVPLRDLLRKAKPAARGIEVGFYGADQKAETLRGKEYLMNFARSLSRTDAMSPDVLVAYAMNGEPLTRDHGAPARLVVPGWFGVAWVKWLTRVEVMDRRLMAKYMGREYVTIRGENLPNGKVLWRETSVGPIDVKSVTARATRLPGGTIRLGGAAWTDGTPLKRVEVRIDDGPWLPATIAARKANSYSWRFWHYDWATPTPGEHTIISRAVDAHGRVQPSKEDPEIAMKNTYWEANQQWPRKLRV